MTTEVTVEQLKAYRLDLVTAKRGISRNIQEVEQKLGSMMTGLEVGDKVSYAHGRTPVRRRATVVGFEPWTGLDTWALWVTSIRRDGSEGAQLTIYPYQDYRKEVAE